MTTTLDTMTAAQFHAYRRWYDYIRAERHRTKQHIALIDLADAMQAESHPIPEKNHQTIHNGSI